MYWKSILDITDGAVCIEGYWIATRENPARRNGGPLAERTGRDPGKSRHPFSVKEAVFPSSSNRV
jgi:hypothetical protein